MKIDGLTFDLTACACPEQYDVYDNQGKIVGYVRLCWGGLTCEYPDVGGEIIYSAAIGDRWTGEFESNEQRMRNLGSIAKAIIQKMKT